MQYLNLACENIIVHDFAAEMTFCFIYDQTTASRPMIIPWHFIVSKKLDLSIIVLKIDAVSQFSL